MAQVTEGNMDAPSTLAYVNSIGNGWGKLASTVTDHRYNSLFNNNEILVDCANESLKNKYIKAINCTDYFINYQGKKANKIQREERIDGMKINGIFKKTSGEIIVESRMCDEENKKRYLLKFNVTRIDNEEPFSVKVYNNGRATHKWGDSIPPESWEGSKHVAFRGGVGVINEKNYRHKYITDFMRDNNYI